MANSLLTINMITNEALMLFRNSNAFIQTVDKQYDASFAKNGAKIGTTLRIRLPNDPVTRSGATANPQSITERNTTLTITNQDGVDLQFSSEDLALSMDTFSERVLAPSINNLGGLVAKNVMSMVEQIPNIVHATDVNNNTISPTQQTWLNAGALLDNFSVPRGQRTAVLSPYTSATTVGSMLNLFNPGGQISKQFKAGSMNNQTEVLGIQDWRVDQTVILHQAGSYNQNAVANVAAGGISNSANGPYNGSVVATTATSGNLNIGDIISFTGVYAVNRVTKASTGQLAQFAVTAPVANGATSISVYPAVIGPDVNGNAVQYQTVVAVPATNTVITSPINGNESYSKNFTFVKEAFTLATADLFLPTGAVIAADRKVFDGISMRAITDYLPLTDQQFTRFDVLYGWTAPRPEWAVAIASK